jgi:hypothetical protein
MVGSAPHKYPNLEITRDKVRTYFRAHRYSYTLLVGLIPHGLELDHRCNTPRCVNPQHLEPVTRTENNRRKGERTLVCKNGHIYTNESTYHSKRGKVCRICMAYYQRNRKAAKDRGEQFSSLRDGYGAYAA